MVFVDIITLWSKVPYEHFWLHHVMEFYVVVNQLLLTYIHNKSAFSNYEQEEKKKQCQVRRMEKTDHYFCIYRFTF